MRKFESIFCQVLPLCVLIGLRLGYCAMFGATQSPTPNLEHSFYHYQRPINDNRLLPFNSKLFRSPATESLPVLSPATAAPEQNPEERPLWETGRCDVAVRRTAAKFEPASPLVFPRVAS